MCATRTATEGQPITTMYTPSPWTLFPRAAGYPFSLKLSPVLFAAAVTASPDAPGLGLTITNSVTAVWSPGIGDPLTPVN